MLTDAQAAEVIHAIRESASRTVLQAVADALAAGHTATAIGLLRESGVWPGEPAVRERGER